MSIPVRTIAWSGALPVCALTMMLGCGLSLATAQHQHDENHVVPEGAEVPLFEGLGDHSFPITTDSEAAQAYFDQGLMLTYGFNHFEAVRAFKEAARQDEACAMCYWGVALALGPHINAPMMPEAVEPAYAALQQAQAHAPDASAREQAYIEALSHRYEAEPPEDRSGLDHAYADAMRDLAAAYPDDLDAQTLFAESLMNLVPWNYWAEDGSPRAETAELVDVLEAVRESAPDHVGANHLYIHAIENSPEPGRAEDAADRLAAADIQIGHMIHMPSHIYARIGRWHDASTANEKALAADAGYLGAYEVEGLVPILYHPHNGHFLAWTAGMEGRSEVATQAAIELAEGTSPEMAAQLPFLNNFIIAPLLTHIRFEDWDALLALPEPATEAVFQRGMWHYGRGLAHARQGDLGDAAAEAEELSRITDSEAAATLELPEAFLPGETMLRIADHTLSGEIALAQGDGEAAVESLRQAVTLQDGLPYFEPPYWFVSARLDLGRALLELDRAEEAEAVFRADLDQYPHNGWALRGLAASLEAQGKATDEVNSRLAEAWQHADVAFAANGVGLTGLD